MTLKVLTLCPTRSCRLHGSMEGSCFLTVHQLYLPQRTEDSWPPHHRALAPSAHFSSEPGIPHSVT